MTHGSDKKIAFFNIVTRRLVCSIGALIWFVQEVLNADPVVID